MPNFFRGASKRAQGSVQLTQLIVLGLVGLLAIPAFGALATGLKSNLVGQAHGRPHVMSALTSRADAAAGWVRAVSGTIARRNPGAVVQNATETPIQGQGIVRGVRKRYEVFGLPWWEHLDAQDSSQARRLQVVDRGERQIRHRVHDSPFSDDGTFTRTVEIEDILYDHVPEAVAPRSEDAPFTFSAKKIGPRYNPQTGELGLRVFAPRHDVSLLLHQFGSATEERLPMKMDHAGVWEVALRRDPSMLTGREYSFIFKDRATGEEHIVSDPYAHGATNDVTRSRLVDLSYDWKSEPGPIADVGKQVIYESHIRDLTRDPSSPIPEALRGSYTGAAHAKVAKMFHGGVPEFMPIHPFDPLFGGHWGYSTKEFFAPSLRYSVAAEHHPRGLATEQQFMELIDSHRAEGRPVVIDVVYNHTANDNRLYFSVAGEDIYYRIEGDGNGNTWLRNGSGTGNEFASEHPMAQKLIVDSLVHFVDKYRIDGFRFDLGALIDIPTLRYIDKRLPKHVFLTMEPWSWQHARFGKDIVSTGALSDTRWTVWNDDARNLFEHIHRHGADNPRDIWSLQKVITGSSANSPTAPDQKPGFTARPNQTVNPVGTHDEAALAHDSTPERMAMTATIGITSQGTPLLQPLMTAMHGKQGIGNTWNLDNEVNWLNWEQREAHLDLEEYLTSLAEFRASRSHFHYDRPLTGDDIQWLHPSGSGIGYRLQPSTDAGPQKPVIVLTNLSTNPDSLARYQLPDGEWDIAFDGETLGVRPQGRGPARGEYYVRPGTAVVLEQR